MNYELTEEQRILQSSAADFLKKECPKELVRKLADTDEKYSPAPGHVRPDIVSDPLEYY